MAFKPQGNAFSNAELGPSKEIAPNRNYATNQWKIATYAPKETLTEFPQAGKISSSDTTVIFPIRDDHKIYEITNINQFYIDL